MAEPHFTHIDPEKFAYNFVNSLTPTEPGDDIERTAKKRLAAYLSAYYLIEQFNDLESTIFPTETEKERANIPYSALLERLTNLNKY
ncbi:MAG TPA: hypothetical protein DCW31_06985 [Lactobacillus sp.]|nr:hypothetical protein [Lactobacillus sp.]